MSRSQEVLPLTDRVHWFVFHCHDNDHHDPYDDDDDVQIPSLIIFDYRDDHDPYDDDDYHDAYDPYGDYNYHDYHDIHDPDDVYDDQDPNK